MVFEQVQADLEAAGFEAFPPVILPACGLDAPHRRERVWFIAHRTSDGCLGDHQPKSLDYRELGQRMEKKYVTDPLHGDGDVADSNIGERSEGGMSSIGPGETERHTGPLDARSYEFGGWDNFPTQSPLRGGNDGISGELDLIGRIEKRDAVHRLKALGNAIVPEVTLQLFKIIQEMDQMLHH